MSITTSSKVIKNKDAGISQTPFKLPNKRVYFVGDLAKYLGVSVSAIIKWCKSGQIESSHTDTGYNTFTRSQVEKTKLWYDQRTNVITIPEAAKRLSTTPHYISKIISDGYIHLPSTLGNKTVMSQGEFKELEIIFNQLVVSNPIMLIPLRDSEMEKREAARQQAKFKFRPKCRVATCDLAVGTNGLVCNPHFTKLSSHLKYQYTTVSDSCNYKHTDIEKYNILLQNKRDLETVILNTLLEQEKLLQDLTAPKLLPKDNISEKLGD